MNTVIIEVLGGVASVACQSDDVTVLILDNDSIELYTYGAAVCRVVSVNDDCTLNLRVVDTLDGSKIQRNIMNVPADQIEFHSSDEDDIITDDDDLSEFGEEY
jgi:hypothetical protein